MASDKVILYDLPNEHKGKGNWACFSFNPWKIRIVLNYKNIPYTTQWVEYPDLATVLPALGIQPNEPGTAFAPYSSPTIKLPDGEGIMHSLAIVKKLEALHPEPSLHLETELYLEAEKAVEAAALVTWWDVMAGGQKDLPPRSKEYFARTRKEIFGASLEDLAAAKGGEAGWKEAEKEGGVLEGLRDFVVKNRKDDGPFVLGKEVSYADFVVVALFECFRICHLPSFERFMAFDPSFPALHKACEKWLERDN